MKLFSLIKLLPYACLGAWISPALSFALPAFPGAEGFGASATGGRGGDVYYVTNLEASGPGSFLNGIQTVPAKGRTIVFSVSGMIPIKKAHLKASNVTIAGQTAPGDGVGLQGSSFRISGDQVVIRHLRFRHGKSGNGGDCLNPDSGSANLILDHCDVMFSTDENFSMFRTAPKNLTFQWSTNAWGLHSHSAGGLWLIDHATAHHTLWANNHTRNPKVICPNLFDWVNNVTFGWDIGMNLAGADKGGVFKVNLRGNSFVHGAKTGNAVFGGGLAPDGTTPFRVHVEDCALDGNGNGVLDVTKTDYDLIAEKTLYTKEKAIFPQTSSAEPGLKEEIIGVPVTVDDRVTAFKKIISLVGPLRMDVDSSKGLRDEVTQRLIDDVVAQKRKIISDEKELGLGNNGMGVLETGKVPLDTDQDGMPDFWETALGSNVNKDDHHEILPIHGKAHFFPVGTGEGYTRLEEYLHFLASPHGVIEESKPLRTVKLSIDLKKFTSGFQESPVFTISNIVGGTVLQTGNGGSVVHFQPKNGWTGRAWFDFTVRDKEGSTLKQTCLLLIIPEPRKH